jgi:hypothetical protein
MRALQGNPYLRYVPMSVGSIGDAVLAQLRANDLFVDPLAMSDALDPADMEAVKIRSICAAASSLLHADALWRAEGLDVPQVTCVDCSHHDILLP